MALRFSQGDQVPGVAGPRKSLLALCTLRKVARARRVANSIKHCSPCASGAQVGLDPKAGGKGEDAR